jgi:ubiquinone/menaquinone biosynthesis C-methylase UbiE
MGKRFNTNKLTTQVADMEKLPFADQSFDAIVSISLSFTSKVSQFSYHFKNHLH